jgi:hypothetical protein
LFFVVFHSNLIREPWKIAFNYDFAVICGTMNGEFTLIADELNRKNDAFGVLLESTGKTREVFVWNSIIEALID